MLYDNKILHVFIVLTFHWINDIILIRKNQNIHLINSFKMKTIAMFLCSCLYLAVGSSLTIFVRDMIRGEVQPINCLILITSIGFAGVINAILAKK